jgi:hypothetical protein
VATAIGISCAPDFAGHPRMRRTATGLHVLITNIVFPVSQFFPPDKGVFMSVIFPVIIPALYMAEIKALPLGESPEIIAFIKFGSGKYLEEPSL